LLLVVGLCACDSSPDAAPPPSSGSRSIVISYSAPGLVGAQHNIHQSLEKHAKEKGWQLITTTSGGDPEKQIEQIKTFLSLRVNAIVAVPDDSKRVCPAVEAARAAKTPFYTIDRAPEGCKVNMVVLSDNAMAGRQSGEAMIALLRQRHGEAKGTVLEITGNMATNVAQLRGKGFHDALGKHPGVKLITKQGDWDTTKGEAIVREALQATPNLDGIYMHSDAVYMPGTLKVLRELGRLHRRGEPNHVFIAAVDAAPAGLQAIRDGYADQCSNQPITDFGIVSDWIEQEMRGQPVAAGEVRREGALWSPARVVMSEVGPELILATTSVTGENVDDARLWANQP
jgi:ABC-type sugar transport system substrate-binding protein